jgi:hypothetical protein
LVKVAVREDVRVDVMVGCRCRGSHTGSHGRIVRRENDGDASRQWSKRDVDAEDDAV